MVFTVRAVVRKAVNLTEGIRNQCISDALIKNAIKKLFLQTFNHILNANTKAVTILVIVTSYAVNI
jgi:hypothetical protein